MTKSPLDRVGFAMRFHAFIQDEIDQQFGKDRKAIEIDSMDELIFMLMSACYGWVASSVSRSGDIGEKFTMLGYMQKRTKDALLHVAKTLFIPETKEERESIDAMLSEFHAKKEQGNA